MRGRSMTATALPRFGGSGGRHDGRGMNMLSNQRYYARRAAEEMSRASRALSAEAREWHEQLAASFARRAQDAPAATLIAERG